MFSDTDSRAYDIIYVPQLLVEQGRTSSVFATFAQEMSELQEARILDGHRTYEPVLRLGTSSCGNAFTLVARNKVTKELASIKLIKRGWDASASRALLRSSLIHMDVSCAMHPHIVECKDSFLLPTHLAIVMEYVEGETLESFIERVGGRCIENLARFIFQQLIIAVDFCHRKGTLLRDIKPSTILLHIGFGSLPLVKIFDFASSKKIRHSSSEEEEDQSGSALFVAPEVIIPPEDQAVDERAADLYTCGVILYIIIYGSHPFLRDSDSSSESEKVMAMFQRVLDGDVEFPTTASHFPTTASQGATPQAPLAVSDQCISIIKGLLNPDPALRLTMEKILLDPWFRANLPEGAEVMNGMLMEDECCHMLTPAQVATFQSLVNKASIDDGSCFEPDTLSSHGSEGNAYSPGFSSNSTGRLGSRGNSPGFQARSGHSLLGRRLNLLESQMSLQPLESMSGLSDALMRIPTGMLLRAAVEDLQAENPSRMDLNQYPSLVAPRSPSSLEKTLLTSPNFVREMQEFGPAALRQNQQALGLAPVSSLASLNASDLAAIMCSIDGNLGMTAPAAFETATHAATNGPKRAGKRRVRDKSRFGAGPGDRVPSLNEVDPMILSDDVTAATDAFLAALRDLGEIGPTPSLQFPWIDGPETAPLASLSAMDASYDWAGSGQEGGLMDSPWAKICNSAASQHAMKRMKQMLL